MGFGAFVLVGMLIGFVRGAYRQLTHTITFLATATLSFAAVKLLIGKFIELLSVETIGDVLTKLQSYTGIDMTALYNIILDLDTEGLEGFLILPATVIVAPLAFVVIFLVLRVILSIVSSIIIHLFRIRRAKGLLERFGGLCLSAVETVLFVSVFLLPITSVAGFVNDAYAVMIEDESESSSELSEQYDEIIMPLAKHPALEIAGRSANNLISASFTDNRAGNEAKNEIVYTFKIAVVDLPKLLEIDFSAISDTDDAIIDNTINDIKRSDFSRTVMSGIIRTFAKTCELQTSATVPPPFDTVLGDLFATFSDTTKETVAEDLKLIKDLLVFMSKNHIMSAMSNGEDLMSVLTAKNPETDAPVINGLIQLMKSNERTKHMGTSIPKLSLSLLTNNLTADSEQLATTYANVKDDVNAVLSTKESDYVNKEAYLRALTNRLDDGLKNNGINLDDSMVRSIAEYVDENLSGKTELTEEEFNDVILSYYSAHIDEFGNGTIPDSFGGEGGGFDLGDIIGGQEDTENNEDLIIPGVNEEKDSFDNNYETDGNTDKTNGFSDPSPDFK